MIKIERALISVSDKSGLVEFAGYLSNKGVEIISTGGTLKALQDGGVSVIPVDDYTGFPEMMDGRLKTLHPKIHGGLLSLRDNENHLKSMQEHGIKGIDLLVVNLYPFAQTVAEENVSLEKAIENIDIGGPTMLRAAAKNYRHTVSVCNPENYRMLMDQIEKNGGISEEVSFEMARAVFNHTASYDSVISEYLNKKAEDNFPETLTLSYRRMNSLRYGENPHQKAAYYRPVMDIAIEKKRGLGSSQTLQGKELSFNNLLDFSSALGAALAMPSPGVVIIKHLNPCGAAVAEISNGSPNMEGAFLAARACDPISAFGGVIGVAGTADGAVAARICENFAEGVIALDFTSEALKIFSEKKNLRVIKVGDPERFLREGKEIRQVYNGVLYQELDNGYNSPSDWKCVTEKKPDENMLKGLEFAWRLVKQVKSNAIVFCSQTASLGIGAGQMSRVDSVEIAVMKAKKNGQVLTGSYVGSDAFFPFRDGVDSVHATGAVAIIQPGGSVRDQEVIDACNEHGIVMMFTGMRHFRH